MRLRKDKQHYQTRRPVDIIGVSIKAGKYLYSLMEVTEDFIGKSPGSGLPVYFFQRKYKTHTHIFIYPCPDKDYYINCTAKVTKIVRF